MSKKHHRPGPIPPGNQQNSLPVNGQPEESVGITAEVGGQEEDPQRRLGDFTGTGEHSIQQPGGKNDSNH